jgi:hypothetical protein
MHVLSKFKAMPCYDVEAARNPPAATVYVVPISEGLKEADFFQNLKGAGGL